VRVDREPRRNGEQWPDGYDAEQTVNNISMSRQIVDHSVRSKIGVAAANDRKHLKLAI
jgi:hypothetical protein